jgi:hypothetical protein
MSADRGEVQAVRAGDWVRIKTAEEIAETLDAEGRLDGMPFMPEMLAHVGRVVRVVQRAERTCVYPPRAPLPRLSNAVVLAGLRCDGSAHGGCQLGCMFFWKDDWLGLSDPPTAPALQSAVDGAISAAPSDSKALILSVHQPGRSDLYRCQGTELTRATTAGPPLWDVSQYGRFLRDRTFTPVELLGVIARIGLRKSFSLLPGRRRAVAAPTSPLNLRAGDWVRVKSKEDIFATLDDSGRLKGLSFGGDMTSFCGRRFRVEKRVETIIDESNGRIRHLRDTVMLTECYCDRYVGCARRMPVLWREAWLERATDPGHG